MKTFSFRAECRYDVTGLLNSEDLKDETIILKIFPDNEGFADVEVEIITDKSVRGLRAAMRTVEDGHVMYKTLRSVPLVRNSLKRSNKF